MSTTLRIPENETFFYNLVGAGDDNTVVGRNSAEFVQGTMVVKVIVPATTESVSLTYDPASLEKAIRTRALNRVVRLGFVPATASTR